MPGKVKVKIIAGKNLPVMDRSSDTTDAYVEIKLGSTTYKTDVCRKSLNPQWNSDWYRFEVDDSELQDEPLQIRLMDHDTYSANDAIGKVYLDLNPLLLPSTTLLPKFGWGVESSNNNEHVTNSVLSGWLPVYDTMHGIRGEVNVIVKVELFSDFNKFRQSSCGVQFFCSPIIPHGYCVQMYHGFVEELIVNDDPEYQWIDKIRTPRASNEARQTLFFKLAGELQRKIGVKALELGGNAVVGYNQCFDLEGELGIVVRGIGTAVTLIKLRDAPPVPVIDTTNEERAQSYLQFLRHDTRFRLNHNNSKPLQSVPYSSTSVLSQNISDDPTSYNLKGGRNLTRHLSYGEFSPFSNSVQSLNCPVVHHASSLQTLLRQEDMRGNPGSGISQRLKNFKYSSQNILAKKMTALKAKLSDSGMLEEDDNTPECSASVTLDGVKNKPLFQRSTSDTSAMAKLLVRSLMHASLECITETHDNSELTSSPAKTNIKQDTTDNDNNNITVKTDESHKLFKKSISEPQLMEPDSLLSMELPSSNGDSSTESSSSSDEDESVSDGQDSTNSEYDTISNIVKNVIHHPDEPMKTLVLDEIGELNQLSESSSLENEMCEMSKHHYGPGKTNVPPLAESENFDIEDNNSVHFLIGDADDDNSNVISTDSASYQNLEEAVETQLNPDCQQKSLIPFIKMSENSVEDQDLIQTAVQTMLLEKLNLVGTYTPPSSPSATDKDKNIFNLQNSSVLQQDAVPGQSQPKSIVTPVKLKDNTAENQCLMKTAVQTLLLDKLKLVSAYSPPSSATIASKEDSVFATEESSHNITPKQPKSIVPPIKINEEDQGLMKTAMQTILFDKLKLMGTYTPPSSPSKVNKENEEFDLEHSNASNRKLDTASEQFEFKPAASGENKGEKVVPLGQSSGLKQRTGSIPKQSRLKSILPPIKVNKDTIKDQGLMQTAMQTMLFDKLKLVGTYTPPSSPNLENKDKNIFNIDKTETKSHQEKSLVPLVKMNETTSDNEPQDKLKLVDTYTPPLSSSVATKEQKVYSFEDFDKKTVPEQSQPKTILPPVKINEGTSKSKSLTTTDTGKNVFDFKNPNVDNVQEGESFFTKIACISESVRKNPAPFRRSSTTHSLSDYDFGRPNILRNNNFTSLDKLYNDNRSITVRRHGGNFVTGDQNIQNNLAKLNIKEASNESLHLSPTLTSSDLISTNCDKSNDFNEFTPAGCLKAISDNLPVNSELDKGNNNMHASLAHSLRTAGSPGTEPARIDHGHQRTESVGAKISQSPARFHPIPFMHRRSSDSDLSITPKGNSLTGSDKSCGMPSGYFSRVGPLLRPSIPQENFDMLEYPFITMSKYPHGFIIYLGGVVSARSVKLLERITNLEEPESRDMWWTELRMEIRSHARALNCNAVLAYSETSSICDDVCVLSASGTAAVIGWQYTGEIGDSIGGLPVIPKPYYANKDVMASSLDRNDFEREKALQKPESILLANIGLNTKPLPESPENETQPAFVNSLSPCTVCHLPYTGNAVPLRTITLKCAVCRIGKVPEILLATIELPEGTPTMGRGCFIQAYVCRPLKDLRSESNAKDISDGLPFLEYELHRILVNKIRIKGMNAVFGLKVRISIGTKMLVGIATGTGVFLLPLPPPPMPKLVSVRSTNEKQLAEMQQLLSATVETNKEIYQLKTTEDSQNTGMSPENEHSEDEQPFLDVPSENRDCCILEVDDPEDMEIMNLLMEPRPPDGFHVVNTELVPGLGEIEIVRNFQMFTQIWRSKLYPSYNFGRHIHKLLQSVYFKLRRMIPCALCDLQFRVDLPDSDEIQLTVLGMALGLGEPQKSLKQKRKNVHVPLRDSVGKNDEDMIFNLEDDHIEGSSIPHQSGSNFLNVQPTKHRTRSPHRNKVPTSKQQALSREKHGIDITPLSYIPGGKIERYLGNLNFFFIRETTSIREEGGLSGFLHSFITEVLAIVRAHVAALGGNAMVAYYMTECVLSHSLHKNQGQCLINVGGDVVFVSYFTEE